MLSRLNATDRLLVGYSLGVAALIGLAGHGEPPVLRLAVLHLALAAAAVTLAGVDAGAGWRWLHRWLPVIVLPWLYDAAGRLRHLLVARDLDAWIARADAWIFPGRWYLAGARWPLPALELAHAVYFSYYLLLFVPALVVERRRHGERRDVDRYLTALTATLLAHYALNFLLPVAGPLAERARDMPEGALFLPLMDAIYFAFDRGGLAFPSTHVAASVVAGWYAGRRFFPNAGFRYALWVTAIATSTVVCAYHYPVDVVAGLVSGGACLAVVLRRERAAAEPG